MRKPENVGIVAYWLGLVDVGSFVQSVQSIIVFNSKVGRDVNTW